MIILDFSQTCIACYTQSSKGFDGSETDLDLFRFSVLNSIRSINSKNRTQYGKLVIAVDCTGSSWRRDQFPYYKAQRIEQKAKSAINWQQVSKFINILYNEFTKSLKYPVIRVDGGEGDDVIGTLTRHKISENEQVLIASGDRDFIQLQRNTDLVNQWDNRHQCFVSNNNPARYLFDHVIRGDRGDGIPNVYCADDHFISKPGKAKAITNKLLDQLWEDPSPVINLPGFKRNINLIDLNRTPKLIQQQIIDKYNEMCERPEKDQLIQYLIDNRLKNLTSMIGDF